MLKSLVFFSSCFIFFIAILATISHSRFAFLFFDRLHSCFFNVGSRKRRRSCWTRFYHFTSFHSLLFYQHFTNKMYIFLLIFVASVGNIKRDLTFHTIIIHPTEIIWKDRNVSLLIKLCISFEVFLMPRKVFVVFNNKIINNFRCILEFQQLVQIIEIVMLTNENV